MCKVRSPGETLQGQTQPRRLGVHLLTEGMEEMNPKQGGSRWAQFTPEERSELMMALEERYREARRTSGTQYIRQEVVWLLGKSLASFLGDTWPPR